MIDQGTYLILEDIEKGRSFKGALIQGGAHSRGRLFKGVIIQGRETLLLSFLYKLK